MTTSGGGWTSAVLFAVVLVCATLLGSARISSAHAEPERHRARPPGTAIVLWSVVAVPSVLQILVPALLDALERDPTQVRDRQWWRILTSVLVQDGGIAGTVVNLAVLAWVAPLAVRVWGGGRAVLLFLASQLIFGLLTSFVFPSSGAGNSAATLALAASIAGLVLMQSKEGRALAVGAGIVGAGVLLVVIDDAHGLAVLTGVFLGAALATVSPPGDPTRTGRPL